MRRQAGKESSKEERTIQVNTVAESAVEYRNNYKEAGLETGKQDEMLGRRQTTGVCMCMRMRQTSRSV